LQQTVVRSKFHDTWTAEQCGWSIFLDGDEICALLGHYAECTGYYLQTFWDRWVVPKRR